MLLIVAEKQEQFPNDDKPEIVIMGRSNIGKSTLINSMTKTNLADISKTPGKTKTVNFYDMKTYYLVDMPGYGYSKNHESKNQKIGDLMTTYLKNREQLNGLLHVCSIHGLNELDLETKDFFSGNYDNYLLLLNKADKLGNMQQKLSVKKISISSNLPDSKILSISAKNNININLIFKTINKWIKESK